MNPVRRPYPLILALLLLSFGLKLPVFPLHGWQPFTYGQTPTPVVMLLAAINYQLNLGYVLTFLLAGSALVGMHVAHATLRGLTLQLHPPPAVFATTHFRGRNPERERENQITGNSHRNRPFASTSGFAGYDATV